MCKLKEFGDQMYQKQHSDQVTKNICWPLDISYSSQSGCRDSKARLKLKFKLSVGVLSVFMTFSTTVLKIEDWSQHSTIADMLDNLFFFIKRLKPKCMVNNSWGFINGH